MEKLELLAPAGDLSIFKSVVNAGADAVYFGGDMFGARAYAKNFSIEDAACAIKYGHFHGAKSYLTVNTLLKNLEIEKNLYSYLKSYVESGIDAFIVQDFGVMEFIKTYFPDTPVHASTQLSLCTSHGAKLLQNFGATRIVTARELSLKEIADIHRECPNLEIESFIHGALCVCYSGQCLMSSFLGGRSGNRGRCAQPCRLPYKAVDSNGKSLNLPGDYILSPKDFCTVKSLPDMIEAGVMSFKIEGRMKQISYATGVVSVYRHYIDEYLKKGTSGYSVKDSDIQKLLDFGNRSGFTDLYLHNHNGREMITFGEPSHNKSSSEEFIAEEKKVKLDARVTAKLGHPFEIEFIDKVGNVSVSKGTVVEPALKKATCRDEILKNVTALGNTAFIAENVSIDMDEGIFLPVSIVKNTRREAIDGLTLNYEASNEARVVEFSEFPAKFAKNETAVDSVFAVAGNMDQIRVINNYSFIKKIAVPFEIFEEAKAALRQDIKVFVSLPAILRMDYASSINIPDNCDGVMVSTFDELGKILELNIPKEKILLDHRLYTFSNRAVKAYENEFSLEYNCIPVELSLKELAHRDNSNSQMIIYSRLPLMITANCSIKNSKGCNKASEVYSLIDRKNMSLPAKAECKYCYNIIYNSKKYMAFGLKNELEKLGVKEYRMDFSLESGSEVKEILSLYQSVFIDNEDVKLDMDHTNGHLKQGVE